jgi:hypothetical protein
MTDPNAKPIEDVEEAAKVPMPWEHGDVAIHEHMINWLRDKSQLATGLIDQYFEEQKRLADQAEKDAQEEAPHAASASPGA